MTEVWEQAPNEWTPITDERREVALQRTLHALELDSERPVDRRLCSYYDIDGDFVGSSFVNLFPVDLLDVTAVDLHALTLMAVPVSAAATRRILEPTRYRTRVLESLAELPGPGEPMDLLTAGPDVLEAMEQFYLAVKDALGTNPWVTASKLCARKRPDLFPVRDEKVCSLLDLIPASGGDYQVDWQVFRYLIGHREVIAAIDAATDAAQERAEQTGQRVVLDTGRLRVLDAALWTWAAGKG